MTGIDGLFIAKSDDHKRAYLRALPYYYRVDLQSQSCLIFNNAACVHFTSLAYTHLLYWRLLAISNAS